MISSAWLSSSRSPPGLIIHLTVTITATVTATVRPHCSPTPTFTLAPPHSHPSFRSRSIPYSPARLVSSHMHLERVAAVTSTDHAHRTGSQHSLQGRTFQNAPALNGFEHSRASWIRSRLLHFATRDMSHRARESHRARTNDFSTNAFHGLPWRTPAHLRHLSTAKIASVR